MPRLLAAALCCFAVGCTVELEGPADASTADAGDLADAGASFDAGLEPDGGPPPPDPEPRAPCAKDRCWEPVLASPRCVTRTIDEDFTSGRYDAHGWAATLWAGVPTTLRLEVTAGAWQPAILVLAADGAVIYDGAIGLVEPGLDVTAIADGRTGSDAEISVTSDVDRSVRVFVTSWTAVDAMFAAGPPMDARYRLTLDGRCPGAERVTCVVNGHMVEEPACSWIHHVALDVVPRLEGTRDEALDAAAAVTWWSLKEGVLSLSNPIVYSSCNFPSGDQHIGPLEVCVDGRAWQVGVSAVQVPGRELDALEATATRLFEEMTADDVLERTAREAAVDDDTRAAVVASTGDLRRSWLLRTSAVGFTFQAPTVLRECVEETREWCDGTGWHETRLYAPDRASALAAIDDVRAILDDVAP